MVFYHLLSVHCTANVHYIQIYLSRNVMHRNWKWLNYARSCSHCFLSLSIAIRRISLRKITATFSSNVKRNLIANRTISSSSFSLFLFERCGTNDKHRMKCVRENVIFAFDAKLMVECVSWCRPYTNHSYHTQTPHITVRSHYPCQQWLCVSLDISDNAWLIEVVRFEWQFSGDYQPISQHE